VASSSNTLTLSGNISQSGTRSLTVNGPGSTVLSGNNTYSGGTAVASGSLFLTNTSGSGAGTGSLTVAGGATLGGTGSYGTTATPGAGYKIAGSSTSNRAQVLVGLTSASDTNTSNALSLIASTATITNANLTFNINDQVKGGLGTDPSNSGTELNVGSTAITFGLSPQATTLTVNVQNYGIIAGFTPYVLIAGNTSGGVDQYSGLNLGTSSGSLRATGLTTQILNSGVGMSGNLTLVLTGLSDTWYGANSYLFLYQDSATGADDIEVEVVPEPGTWALMLGGLAMLIFWQRSRRKDRGE
jgi:autotransporter-associated beta strand protein